MKKRLLSLALLAAATLTASAQPKYLFYFIGDGMGLSITHAAELYKAERAGSQDGKPLPLLFSGFPTIGIMNTTSASNLITDSAAAGTALASGEKTTNGTIGLSADHSRELESLADKFKSENKGVAILSSVSLDHATPAAFYAHNPSRKNYFEIAIQGAESSIDILGGSGFVEQTNESGASVYAPYQKAGFTHIKGKAELSKMDEAKGQILITERDGVSHESMAFATDRTQADLSLSDLVSTSIDYLYENYSKEGFMIMAEAGQIDWANHSHDVNGAMCEIIDLEDAVRFAFEFYKKHPQETLIVVTSDHETGGFTNGRSGRGYNMDMSRIKPGLESHASYENKIKDMVEGKVSFEKLPLPSGYSFTSQEKSELEQIYNEILSGARTDKFEDVVFDYINFAMGAGWTTPDHTGAPVIVYSIGEDSEDFAGYFDNTDLPKKMAEVTNVN